MGRGGDGMRRWKEVPGEDSAQDLLGMCRQEPDEKTLIDYTVDTLLSLASRTDPTVRRSMTFFDAHSSTPPRISLQTYLYRWQQYAETSEDVLVSAMVYIKRSRIPLTPLNIHRLILAALLLASKWREDLYFTNAYYALVGGVSLSELNRLECALLCAIEWNIHVSREEYDETWAQLIHHHSDSVLKLQCPWENLNEDPIPELWEILAQTKPVFECFKRAASVLYSFVGCPNPTSLPSPQGWPDA
eukprot:Hpha_TRINITY_DN13105_c0_g1::TRINITY_DN13105_c0_g1_i1::g.113414::m.113414